MGGLCPSAHDAPPQKAVRCRRPKRIDHTGDTAMASSDARDASIALPTVSAKRWVQLLIGILCMSMIANLQYGWTLFVNPIHDKFLWTRAEIQIAFTIFVLTETWLV